MHGTFTEMMRLARSGLEIPLEQRALPDGHPILTRGLAAVIQRASHAGICLPGEHVTPIVVLIYRPSGKGHR
jgi:hypothetical protein